MFCHCVGNDNWEASYAAESAGMELELTLRDVQVHLWICINCKYFQFILPHTYTTQKHKHLWRY